MNFIKQQLITTPESVASKEYLGHRQLTATDSILLKHLWYLTPYQARKLDTPEDTTFLTSVGSFLDHLETEEYPRTWDDKFLTSLNPGPDGPYEDVKNYFVSYIFCSGSYLDDLAADNPDTTIAFKLRSIRTANFFSCLVRPLDKRWTVEKQLRDGAKEV